MKKVMTGGVMVLARKGFARIETEFNGEVEAASVRSHCEAAAASGKFGVVFVRWYTDNGKCGIEGEDFLAPKPVPVVEVAEVVKKVRKSRKKTEAVEVVSVAKSVKKPTAKRTPKKKSAVVAG